MVRVNNRLARQTAIIAIIALTTYCYAHAALPKMPSVMPTATVDKLPLWEDSFQSNEFFTGVDIRQRFSGLTIYANGEAVIQTKVGEHRYISEGTRAPPDITYYEEPEPTLGPCPACQIFREQLENRSK